MPIQKVVMESKTPNFYDSTSLLLLQHFAKCSLILVLNKPGLIMNPELHKAVGLILPLIHIDHVPIFMLGYE